MRTTIRASVDFLPGVIVSIVFLVVAAYGQSTATLFGRIFDPDGALVPGAAVAMKNLVTGEERTAHSDSQGNYQIAALPAE
jgi:hypothetical protein